jgi:hypothetical protein
MGPYANNRRRRRKSSRLKKRLTAVALVGLAGCAVLLTLSLPQWTPEFEPEPEPTAPVAATTAPAAVRPASYAVPVAAAKKPRRVYPYSIVPGGVVDRGELLTVMNNDRVAAAHYASFDVTRVRQVTVTRPRAVYVSYRKGDKVYWTARKLMLAQGETLLSDGSSEIRTRCGNRISDVPQLPVELKGPTPEELDTPVGEEQGALTLTALSMDALGDAPASSRSTSSVNPGVLAHAGSESSSVGKPIQLAQVDAIGATPVTAVGWTPPVAASSTPVPGSTGGSGGVPGTRDPAPGGTPGGSDVPAPPPGKGTGGGTETPPMPGNPGHPIPSTNPDPGPNPVPNPGPNPGPNPAPNPGPNTRPNTRPDTKPPVPPSIPNELPPEPVPVPPRKTPAKPVDVPEPSTLWLGAAGLAAMLLLRRRRAPSA